MSQSLCPHSDLSLAPNRTQKTPMTRPLRSLQEVQKQVRSMKQKAKIEAERMDHNCILDSVQNIDPQWTEEELLQQDALFHLEDVCKHLSLYSPIFKTKAYDYSCTPLEGTWINSAWADLGIILIADQWVVRMDIFASVCREYLQEIRVKEVKKEWDGNDLLMQEGIFYLAHVCSLIPFNAHQLRYQYRKRKNPKEEIGIFKDPEDKSYLVDMSIFSSWVRKVWTYKKKCIGSSQKLSNTEDGNRYLFPSHPYMYLPECRIPRNESMVKKPIGRPMKYRNLLLALIDDVGYSPGSIAEFAEENGYLEGADKKVAKQRIRIALGRFSNNHEFPDEGDEIITRTGQAPTPAWKGSRWKAAVHE